MGKKLVTVLNPAQKSLDISNIPGFSQDGFFVKWNSFTSVKITSGTIEANGKVYTLASDITHNMTSLAVAFDFHYIYIDDSASTAPTPVIIDTTTEPTFDSTRRGWYNGDDRMVGVVPSVDFAAQVFVFETFQRSKTIIFHAGLSSFTTMSTGQLPAGAWQTPNINDADVVTPVNAVGIGIAPTSVHIANIASVYVSTAEFAAIQPTIDRGQWELTGFDFAGIVTWLTLGPSRQIKVAVEPSDSSFGINCIGFEYTR
jgi:hypothetical protein